MNLRRVAPAHSKIYGPTVMTSASAELLGAWSRDGTKWHLGSTGLAHSFPKVHAAERKLGLRSGPTSLISFSSSTFGSVFLAERRSRLSTYGERWCFGARRPDGESCIARPIHRRAPNCHKDRAKRNSTMNPTCNRSHT